MNRYLKIIVFVILVAGCGGAAVPQHTADQAVQAFKAAGLEAESPTPMERSDYGLAPMVGQGIHFLLPSLCEKCGGRVIAVEDATERQRMADYYINAGKRSAFLFSHVYIVDNLVVQLNGDLPDDQAAKYRAALDALK